MSSTNEYVDDTLYGPISQAQWDKFHPFNPTLSVGIQIKVSVEPNPGAFIVENIDISQVPGKYIKAFKCPVPGCRHSTARRRTVQAHFNSKHGQDVPEGMRWSDHPTCSLPSNNSPSGTVSTARIGGNPKTGDATCRSEDQTYLGLSSEMERSTPKIKARGIQGASPTIDADNAALRETVGQHKIPGHEIATPKRKRSGSLTVEGGHVDVDEQRASGGVGNKKAKSNLTGTKAWREPAQVLPKNLVDALAEPAVQGQQACSNSSPSTVRAVEQESEASPRPVQFNVAPFTPPHQIYGPDQTRDDAETEQGNTPPPAPPPAHLFGEQREAFFEAAYGDSIPWREPFLRGRAGGPGVWEAMDDLVSALNQRPRTLNLSSLPNLDCIVSQAPGTRDRFNELGDIAAGDELETDAAKDELNQRLSMCTSIGNQMKMIQNAPPALRQRANELLVMNDEESHGQYHQVYEQLQYADGTADLSAIAEQFMPANKTKTDEYHARGDETFASMESDGVTHDSMEMEEASAQEPGTPLPPHSPYEADDKVELGMAGVESPYCSI